MMAKQIDKDAIISGLQDTVQTMTGEINELRDSVSEWKALSNENYENGRAWKEQVDKAEHARKDSLAKERAAAELMLQAEKKLSFAEGYIAALKGDPYEKPVAEERGW
jgi:hypothetical protein